LSTFPATFSGQSVDSSAVLIRYVYSGDANLDGAVDTIDFNLLASSFGQSGKSWFNGDFNYSGTVDMIDFNLLASNFGQTLPAPVALVPEGSFSVLFALSLGLCKRRARLQKI